MAGKISRTKAPDQTFEEVRYLKHLIDTASRVRIRLRQDKTGKKEVEGVIEFYDKNFIRLTRERQPNLFVFKHDIKYLYEIE